MLLKTLAEIFGYKSSVSNLGLSSTLSTQRILLKERKTQLQNVYDTRPSGSAMPSAHLPSNDRTRGGPFPAAAAAANLTTATGPAVTPLLPFPDPMKRLAMMELMSLGRCPHCTMVTIDLSTMEPLTVEGEIHRGRCLYCIPFPVPGNNTTSTTRPPPPPCAACGASEPTAGYASRHRAQAYGGVSGASAAAAPAPAPAASAAPVTPPGKNAAAAAAAAAARKAGGHRTPLTGPTITSAPDASTLVSAQASTAVAAAAAPAGGSARGSSSASASAPSRPKVSGTTNICDGSFLSICAEFEAEEAMEHQQQHGGAAASDDDAFDIDIDIDCSTAVEVREGPTNYAKVNARSEEEGDKEIASRKDHDEGDANPVTKQASENKMVETTPAAENRQGSDKRKAAAAGINSSASSSTGQTSENKMVETTPAAENRQGPDKRKAAAAGGNSSSSPSSTGPARKKHRNSYSSDPIARDIQALIDKGWKEGLTQKQRDKSIEDLRMKIEDISGEDGDADKTKYANIMIAEGAAQMILFATKQIKKSHKNAATCMAECCHTLAMLAFYGSSQDETLVSAGAIPVLVKALKEFRSGGNMKLFLHGIEALQCLSDTSIASKQIIDNGGLQIVFDVMSAVGRKGKSTKVATLIFTLKLIDNVSNSSEDDKVCEERAKKVAEAGFLQPIVAAMKDNPAERELQLAACSAIASLAVSEKNCSDIVEYGGIEGLLALSGGFLNDAEVQTAILIAQNWVATDQELIQLKVIKDGCIENTLKIMRRHCDNADVVAEALSFLDILSENWDGRPRSIKADVVACVKEAQANYKNSEDIRIPCQSILSNL